MLSKWTGDEFESSVHRVVDKEPIHRYSVVFIFDGNLDCPLDPSDAPERKMVKSWSFMDPAT